MKKVEDLLTYSVAFSRLFYYYSDYFFFLFHFKVKRNYALSDFCTLDFHLKCRGFFFGIRLTFSGDDELPQSLEKKLPFFPFFKKYCCCRSFFFLVFSHKLYKKKKKKKWLKLVTVAICGSLHGRQTEARASTIDTIDRRVSVRCCFLLFVGSLSPVTLPLKLNPARRVRILYR